MAYADALRSTTFTGSDIASLIEGMTGGVSVTTEADFAAAIAANDNIILETSITLTANRTVSYGLDIRKGGNITTAGYTLTINGPFEAGNYSCFTTTAGEVVFGLGSINEVIPHWFGAVGDNSTDCTLAFTKAVAAINTNINGRIFVPAGIYRHTGITLGASQSLYGAGAKVTVLRYTSATGNGVTLSDGAANTSYNSITDLKIDCLTTSTGKAIAGPADPYYVADVYIDRYEIEGFLVGIYIPYGLHVEIGFGRLLGQGKAVANGIGVELGDRTLGTPRLVNTGHVKGAYCSGYYTSFVMDGSILGMTDIISENCTRAILWASRMYLSSSWIQADTTLYQSRTGGWELAVYNCYHLDGASVEVDDPATMSTLATSNTELSIHGKSEWKGAGVFRMRFASALGRGMQFGTTSSLEVYSASGTMRVYSTSRPLEVNRDASGALTLMNFLQQGTVRGSIGVDASNSLQLIGAAGNACLTWDTNQNVVTGAGALGTTATNGFCYIPTCAGTPTGAPTAKSGFVPLIVDTTNNKLYFYSNSAWRDAGP